MSHSAKLGLSVVLKQFWGNSYRELFFLVEKVTISETRLEILRFFFFTMFEMGNSIGKLGFG